METKMFDDFQENLMKFFDKYAILNKIGVYFDLQNNTIPEIKGKFDLIEFRENKLDDTDYENVLELIKKLQNLEKSKKLAEKLMQQLIKESDVFKISYELELFRQDWSLPTNIPEQICNTIKTKYAKLPCVMYLNRSAKWLGWWG